MTTSWKTELDRSIPIMENSISGLLQEKWAFFGLDIDKRYPVGMCFPDRWTWHITVSPLKTEPSKFY